jgi:hypothetical protein
VVKIERPITTRMTRNRFIFSVAANFVGDLNAVKGVRILAVVEVQTGLLGGAQRS